MSCDRCSECSGKALDLLAVVENGDYEEGGSAVFELRKLLPNLDLFIKHEVADQIEKVGSLPTQSSGVDEEQK